MREGEVFSESFVDLPFIRMVRLLKESSSYLVEI